MPARRWFESRVRFTCGGSKCFRQSLPSETAFGGRLAVGVSPRRSRFRVESSFSRRTHVLCASLEVYEEVLAPALLLARPCLNSAVCLHAQLV